jgi:hypothetical protein
MDLFIINRIRRNLIKHLFKYHVHLDCACAEFGVYKGTTARYIRNETTQQLFLFDSFEGLPEDWDNNFKKGDFRLKQIPQLPSNVILYKGLFEDAIPKFINDYRKPLSFIHIDSDLYSSAKDVLYGLNSYIVPGTVILFDEYPRGENIAFREWMDDFSHNCILLKKTLHLQAAYVVIK